jgi:hypothetical protein
MGASVMHWPSGLVGRDSFAREGVGHDIREYPGERHTASYQQAVDACELRQRGVACVSRSRVM